MKKLDLTTQEIKDLQAAIEIAEQEFTKHGDFKIASRLKNLKEKVAEPCELSNLDVRDLQHALIAAMKEHDEHGATELADKLELIKDKVDELQ